MDGIRPMSAPWLGRQGRSTILPPSSVIQTGPYRGSVVLTSKLSKVILTNWSSFYNLGSTLQTIVMILALLYLCQFYT